MLTLGNYSRLGVEVFGVLAGHLADGVGSDFDMRLIVHYRPALAVALRPHGYAHGTSTATPTAIRMRRRYSVPYRVVESKPESATSDP